MGFFDKIFSKKKKFDNLTHEDVNDAIVSLERQLNDLENGLLEKDKEIEDLMNRGKTEKSRDMKIFLAKKINFLRDEKASQIQRATYLMYNIKLMNRLRTAVDDNAFFGEMSRNGLNDLLRDQKGLAKFLNKALDTRVESENVLTEADDLFNEVQDSYMGNDQIYGQSEADDALLAVFETDSQTNDGVQFGEDEATREESVKGEN